MISHHFWGRNWQIYSKTSSTQGPKWPGCACLSSLTSQGTVSALAFCMPATGPGCGSPKQACAIVPQGFCTRSSLFLKKHFFSNLQIQLNHYFLGQAFTSSGSQTPPGNIPSQRSIPLVSYSSILQPSCNFICICENMSWMSLSLLLNSTLHECKDHFWFCSSVYIQSRAQY